MDDRPVNGPRASVSTGKLEESFIPDSAVAIDAKSEEQIFHSEANRLLPLSRQHTSVLRLCIQIP